MQIGTQEQVGGALGQVWGYLPTLLGAIAILLIGWILAVVVSRLVRRGLRSSHIGDRAQGWLRGEKSDRPIDIPELGGRVAFALAMVFVLVAFFQTLSLTLVTEPLNALLAQLAAFMPRLFGAGVLLGAAWLAASLLRKLVEALVTQSGVEAMLNDPNEDVPAEQLSGTLGDVAYWLTLFLFLPAVLGALAIDGLLGPVENVTDQVLGFLPNLAAATIILGAGWLGAKLLREVVRNLAGVIGVDRVGERVGLSGDRGNTLSELVGLAVYLLILVPVVISALNALEMAAITGPASAMLGQILSAVPVIFAAGLLLGFAFVVGRLVADMARALLDGVRFEAFLERTGLYRPSTAGPKPTEVVVQVIFAGILLFASMQATEVLGFTALTELIQGVTVFAGQAILALVILGLGFYLATLADKAIQAGASPVSPVLGIIARVGILLLSGAMALQQVGVGGQITSIAFGSIIGALAVAAALAFGLGGREVARAYLVRWSEALGEQGAGVGEKNKKTA